MVTAHLDAEKYPLTKRVSPALIANLKLERAAFHPEWNYTLRPRSADELAAATQRIAEARVPVSYAERRARWARLVAQYLQSGLTLRAFCVKHGVERTGLIRARVALLGKIRKEAKPAE